MDFFGPREVLIVVGLLVVVAILLDGVRRVKRHRYENLHMSSRKMHKVFEDDDYSDDDLFDKSQFPSGGSRVVGVRDDDDLEQVEQSLRRSTEPKILFNYDRPTQNQFDLGETEEQPAGGDRAKAGSATDQSEQQPQEVLVAHLMAPKGEPMSGQLLLNTAVEAGLRFGDMKIFHRHTQDDGSGPVLFSMAKVVNPGTFDLKEMPEEKIPGVTLFMALDDLEDPVAAFDILIDVVDQLAVKLQLNVLDESRSSMTRQTIDHYRQRAQNVALRRGRD